MVSSHPYAAQRPRDLHMRGSGVLPFRCQLLNFRMLWGIVRAGTISPPPIIPRCGISINPPSIKQEPTYFRKKILLSKRNVLLNESKSKTECRCN